MRDGLLHIRDVEGPKGTGSVETRLEAMEQQVFKCQGMVERGINASHLATRCSRSSLTTTSRMPRTPRRPSSSYMRRSTTSKPKSMTCKTKTVSMNIDSKECVWPQIRGFRRLDHPSMMVNLCLGRWMTSPHHQQHLHRLLQQRRIEYLGMGTPLGNCQAWGSAPVSYHHHIFIFITFLSKILLVIS